MSTPPSMLLVGLEPDKNIDECGACTQTHGTKFHILIPKRPRAQGEPHDAQFHTSLKTTRKKEGPRDQGGNPWGQVIDNIIATNFGMN